MPVAFATLVCWYRNTHGNFTNKKMNSLAEKLHEAASKHGTDKGAENHSFDGTSYLDVYGMVFAPAARRDGIKLLELGVKDGASLRMWCEVFPSWEIIGVDIAKSPNLDVGNATFYCRDRTDPWLRNLGPLDAVIDDASHFVGKTLRSFQLLFPVLSPGGVYIIEDVSALYTTRNNLASSSLNPNEPDNNPQAFGRFIERLAVQMNYRRGSVKGISLMSNIAVIMKANDSSQ